MEARVVRQGPGSAFRSVVGIAIGLGLVLPGLTSRAGDDQANAGSVSGTPVVFENPGFEKGNKAVAGWEEGGAIPGVEYIWDRSVGHESASSACIRKTAQRFFPIAEWRQTVANAGTTSKLRVSVWIKADAMRKAIIDVRFVRKGGKPGHQWAAYVGAKRPDDPPANHDWKEYSGVVAVPPGTEKLIIAMQVYGPGTAWFDDVRVEFVPNETPASLYDEAGNPKRTG